MQRAGKNPWDCVLLSFPFVILGRRSCKLALSSGCDGEGEKMLGRVGEGVCQFCGMPAVLKQRTFELVCYHGKLEEY